MNTISYYEKGQRVVIEVDKEEQIDEVIRLMEDLKHRNDGHFQTADKLLRKSSKINRYGGGF